MKNLLNIILTPKLKCELKKWLHLTYRVLRNQNKIITNNAIEIISKNKSDLFFGYYDVTPFSEDDKKLIYIERASNDKVFIHIKDLIKESDVIVAESHAWNWQQGTRLRWISNSQISFNDFINEKYVNRIVNTKTQVENIIEWPLYDISKNNEIGLSLNFERLGYLRPGYGYRCLNINPMEFGNDGILIISIPENKIIKHLHLTLIHKMMESMVPLDKCYINHLSFNPKSNKFLFFWIEIVNGYHKASLVIYDLESDKFSILERDQKVSHYVWENDSSIICTSYSTPSTCNYYRYNVDNYSKDLIEYNELKNDGHPSMFKDDEIITDTYPDKNGYQHLFKANLKTGEVSKILQIYSSPVVNGETRTDLHPRLNRCKDKICIDSRMNKNRELILIKLK